MTYDLSKAYPVVVKRALPRSILDLIPQDDDGNILSCKVSFIISSVAS